MLYEPEVVKTLDQQLNELGFVPDIYSPEYTTVDVALIAQCKHLGIKVIPWTVNNVTTMQQLKLLGVAGIISDYPDLFSKL